jgi:hypothetical protein
MSHRAWVIAVFSAAASYLLLQRTGTDGLPEVVALWAVTLPFALRPLWPSLRAEALGVVFLFSSAAYIETLDNFYDVERRASLAMLVCGLAYLLQRRRTLREIARSPTTWLLALFLALEVLNAALHDAPDVMSIAANRFSVGIAFACAAVLTRRPHGQRLMPSVLIWAVLISLPIMLRQLLDPWGMRFGWLDVEETDAARAGGLYIGPNGAGAMCSFGIAFVTALAIDGALPKVTRTVLLVGLAIGVLATASRGSLLVAILVAYGYAIARGWQSRHFLFRLVLSHVVLGIGLLLLDMANDYLSHMAAEMDAAEGTSLSRLLQVIQAITGSPDELVDHGSVRLGLANEAMDRIADRPLFGWGPEFMKEAGPHVQFLEILGRHGLVGGVIYGGLLWSLARRVHALPLRVRLGACLVGGAWLFTQFFNHNMMEYRYLVLPLGWLVGIDSRQAEGAKQGAEYVSAVGVLPSTANCTGGDPL